MSDDIHLIIPILVVVLIGCFGSNRIGVVAGVDKVQQEAVIKGHAEWVADKDGKAVFKWKEAK
jgi:hypothetical protein